MTDTPADRRPLAVVTGASSGIGYELAKQFAEHGYDLLIAAEDPGISDAAARLGRTGVAATPVQSDLATYDGVERLCDAIRAEHERLEAVAINAGRGAGGDFTRDTDLRDEFNIIDVNVTSTVHLAKRVLPGMVARGRGRILFTSSIASAIPGSYQAVYNASKSFVQSFAEGIRGELKDTGVTVTALMPGPTETDFFERAGMQDTRIGAASKDDPAKVAAAGYEALMAGKDHVVAGSMKNKVQAVAAKVVPDAAKAAMHRVMARPGSAATESAPAEDRFEDVVDLLTAQHERIKAMFGEVADATDARRQQVFEELIAMLRQHESGEQQVVHPVLRDLGGDESGVALARLDEEQMADRVVAELVALGTGDDGFDAKFDELRAAVLAHAAREERAEFPVLRRRLTSEQLHQMAGELRAVAEMM
jgi:uncharacterized protein